MRNPIYKMCTIHKQMHCNPDACGMYTFCKEERFLKMSVFVVQLMLALSMLDFVIGDEDLEP